MYHHNSQQQGSQPFPNGPRPPHRQPPPNQNQNRPASDMMSQVMGFQFPRPTQLPDELESALSIRGARDMDHRLIDHMNQSNPHQNQSIGSAISQHGNYNSSSIPLTSDNQPGHQQGVDWSNYQSTTKPFANPQSSASHQPQQHQGPQQQPQSSNTGTNNPTWNAPVNNSPSPQTRHPHGGGGDGQGVYTTESAGSILASFGLSNADLEVLSHYPDEQLTPDTLPFILRDIQINKSGNQSTVASTSTPAFSSPLAHSHSPEVPRLLSVSQTAGQVIDYGHASRAKEETINRETFKREQISTERTVQMYPSPSSSSSTQKTDKTERRQGNLEHSESSKHGDQDYRRTGSEYRRSHRSPGREFPSSSKSRNLDRDYRQDVRKPGPSPDTRSEASSRRSLSSSSGSKSHSNTKKLPSPPMISDFSAESPKVYPHTCSLCHIQCEQEKDWVDHINTVNHTAACRDLRNKYPDWKPDFPSPSGQYGSRALWHAKEDSPSHSVSRSLSGSISPSPPHSRHRAGPYRHRPRERSYSPQHHRRYPHFTGGSSRSGVKRPYDYSTKLSSDSRHPSSSKVGPNPKHVQSSTKSVKSVSKPGSKTAKTAGVKTADALAKPPPAKKKKKVVTPTSQDYLFADRLVYLTGIPKDASEQEVTDLVRSFGKINNVILMPCSEEESEKGEGQKASVCMLTAGFAQALSNSTDLSIRGQQITASLAKKPESLSSDTKNSKPTPGENEGAAGEDGVGAEADVNTSDEKGLVVITGLPESSWSESDITTLLHSFGSPCDFILAKQIGKLLVSMSDMEIAEEMVKVNSFTPLKMNDCPLNMTLVKQNIGFKTPVALYNLLMGSVDPAESTDPVGWSSLVVISNVPNTLAASTEVQKLVRRFGTVIKTLVLNSVVICEMATSTMALSVYKRFQTFPCIIHNNPLVFSRKPDPKATVQTKVITANVESPEAAPVSEQVIKRVAAEEEEKTASQKKAESPSEGKERSSDGKDEEMSSAEKTVDDDQAVEHNGSKDNEDQKDGPTAVYPDSLKPQADLGTDVKDTSESVTETPEEKKDISASEAGNEETKPSSSDDTAAPSKIAMPELPKMTQEMVNALLVECRTRTASHPTNTVTTTSSEQEETQMETEYNGEKPVEEKQKQTKEDAEEKQVKKLEMGRKEREVKKEKEAKERRERERKAWEKEKAKRDKEREDRAKREREKKEEERRQWERRERERRERKRAYCEGSRSHRLEGHKSRDERLSSSRAEPKTVDEECDEFPFNMSDFVTVDEVGEVADLPSPAIPMETTKEDAPEDTPMEVTAETVTSDATVVLMRSDEHQSVSVTTDETSEGLMSSDVILTTSASPAQASQSNSSLSQAQEPSCDPEAPETESFSMPASGEENSSHSSGVKVKEDETEDPALDYNQAVEEKGLSDQRENFKTIQNEDDKEKGTAAAETEAPAVEAEAPSAETEAPAVQAGAPSAETEAPAVEVGAPSAETEAPAVEAGPAATPVAVTESPATETEAPATEKEAPAIKKEAPAIKKEAATAEKEAPATEKESPATEKESPAAAEAATPVAVTKSPAMETEAPAAEKETPAAEKEAPAMETGAPAVETGMHEQSDDQTHTEEESKKNKLMTETPTSTNESLPPFDPSKPVGMEFLVPKVGFFCKACNRFFTGDKEAEINHCKTLKHYTNLQKLLQTRRTVTSATKANSK